MTSDPLIDAIVTSPDDDAPRLVWADREGDERGELVVVQCALAKAPVDRERLEARERELLARAGAWMPLDGIGSCTFRRGFVEHLSIAFEDFHPRVEDVFDPTIRSLELRAIANTVSAYAGPTASEEWQRATPLLRDAFRRLPPGRVLGLEASTHVYENGDWSDPGSVSRHGDGFVALVVEAPALSELRELLLMDSGLTRASIPNLAKLEKLASLRIADHELDSDALIELLRAVPTLRRLAPWSGRHALPSLQAFLGAPEFEQLEALDVLRFETPLAFLETLAPPIRNRFVLQ